jgi:beta-glucosidase
MSTAFDQAVQALRDGVDELTTATGLLAQVTPVERLGMLDGDQEFWAGLLGFYEVGYNTEPIIAGQVQRLGIPGIRFTDGPRGVVIGHSTCFPVPMARGASWDVELEERIGRTIGAEARAQGANFFAGVCVNLLRHPAWGRAQETYGEDPVLIGALGEALMRGAQHHVMACVKHFALNSMENARFKVDVQVAADVLREVYLPHFRQIVEAGAASVMSSYNSVNGTWAGDNRELLTGILREEWGFEGFVVSDFVYGLRDPAGSLRAGLDVELPFRQQRDAALPSALASGELTQDEVDTCALRVLRMQLRFAAAVTDPMPSLDVVACHEHRALAREAAVRSTVLLRNEEVDGVRLLPLSADRLGRLAVIGSLANIANTGDSGSSNVRAPGVITALDGLRLALGSERVTFDEGLDAACAAQIAADADAVLIVVGYTARDEGEYVDDGDPVLTEALFPAPADQRITAEFAAAQARNAGTFGSGSGGDRASLRLTPKDEELIRAVAAANPRSVVAVVAGSAVVVEPWYELPAAIVMSWYAGMEGGGSLAEVLLGDAEPGGRLPFVIPQDPAQLPDFSANATSVVYDRWYGYRKMDRDGTEPRYPFGFGLGYTDFELVNAAVDRTSDRLEVAVEARNVGSRPGSHVVQVYGGPAEPDPERARRDLLGFARVSLDVGQSAVLHIPLTLRPLARWNVEAGGWCEYHGALRLEVASHHGDPDAIELRTQAAPFTTSDSRDAAATIPLLSPRSGRE